MNETNGIVTKSSSVSHTLMRSMSGRMMRTTKTVWSVYITIGPASWRTAARSLVARAIRSPVRCAWKKRERLALEVRVEVLPQVVLDMARHADENAALEEEEDAADDARADDEQRRARDVLPRRPRAQVVHRAPDEDRDEQPDDRPGQDAEHAHDERGLVRSEVEREFSQIVHER